MKRKVPSQHDLSAYLSEHAQWLLDGQVLLLPAAEQPNYQSNLKDALPGFAKLVEIVGYDWQGRPFGPKLKAQNTLLIYDAIFDEVMEFEFEKGDWRTSRLFKPELDCFGAEEFRSFKELTRIDGIELGKCAGFRVPPQLGGDVSASNTELYDVSTYWRNCSAVSGPVISFEAISRWKGTAKFGRNFEVL